MIRLAQPYFPRLRLFFFLLGVVFLFWLPFEDSQILIPVLLAFATSLLWVVRISSARPLNTYKDLIWQIWIGILAGLAVAPLAVFIIFFKNGLHNHGVPDFSPAQLIFIFRRTPLWGGVGLLIGLGSGIWRMIPAQQID